MGENFPLPISADQTYNYSEQIKTQILCFIYKLVLVKLAFS